MGILGVFAVYPEVPSKLLRIPVDRKQFDEFFNKYGFTNKRDWSVSVDKVEVVRGDPYIFERYLGCWLGSTVKGEQETYELLIYYSAYVDMSKTIRVLG